MASGRSPSFYGCMPRPSTGGSQRALVVRVRGLKGRTVELSWSEWSLFRLVVFLITVPVVVAAVYLIFRKRGP